MSSTTTGGALRSRPFQNCSNAALFAALAMLLGQSGVNATSCAPLSFFKNYFVTGDYVVGGTSLWRQRRQRRGQPKTSP